MAVGVTALDHPHHQVVVRPLVLTIAAVITRFRMVGHMARVDQAIKVATILRQPDHIITDGINSDHPSNLGKEAQDNILKT